MMREIKFREWHQNHMRYWDDIGFFHLYVLNDGKSVFEQYTGLKDKNGVEIYEGDILRIPLAQAYYLNNTVAIVSYTKHDEWVAGNLQLSYIYQAVEVIGNIHGNPELLEGGDE